MSTSFRPHTPVSGDQALTIAMNDASPGGLGWYMQVIPFLSMQLVSACMNWASGRHESRVGGDATATVSRRPRPASSSRPAARAVLTALQRARAR